MNDVTTSTEAKTPLTTAEKLEQAKARVAKLEQALLTEQLLNNIEEGDQVKIKFGRGEKVRHIDGKVVGVARADDGTVSAVAVIDSELATYKVAVRDVLANPTADARRNDGQTTEAAAASLDSVDADDAAGDPLEQA